MIEEEKKHIHISLFLLLILPINADWQSSTCRKALTLNKSSDSPAPTLMLPFDTVTRSIQFDIFISHFILGTHFTLQAKSHSVRLFRPYFTHSWFFGAVWTAQVQTWTGPRSDMHPMIRDLSLVMSHFNRLLHNFCESVGVWDSLRNWVNCFYSMVMRMMMFFKIAMHLNQG